MSKTAITILDINANAIIEKKNLLNRVFLMTFVTCFPIKKLREVGKAEETVTKKVTITKNCCNFPNVDKSKIILARPIFKVSVSKSLIRLLKLYLNCVFKTKYLLNL
ncbi:hypothetical protein GCM10022396_02030 [Flavivirga amylovorans]